MPISDSSSSPWLLNTIIPVLDESPDSIHILDLTGNLIYANHIFFRMLGYNLTDELPCHVSQWDAQWNTDDLPAFVTDLIPHDTPVQTRHRRQNGSSYDAAINVVRITHGGQAYLFCTMRDVTAQHQAEVTLRKHEEQYRSLSERVGFRASQSHIPKKPIWLCDALFTVLSDKLLVARFPPAQMGHRQELDTGAFGYAARTRQSLILNDYPAWPEALPAIITLGLICVLVVPMLQGDRLVGILGVGITQQGRTFTTDDERLLTLFAQQATVAIINARLNTQLLIDPLTGVHNRGRFFGLAKQMLHDAEATGQLVGVAILDLDHFKQVNDTYGHRVGDDVLRGIAAHCVALLPLEAVIGRIGGEEFGVIFPDMDESTTVAALDVVRQHIAETPVPTRQGKLTVTMSVGVTTLDSGNEMILDELLDQADRALYQAKRDGRNRICTFTANAKALAETRSAPHVVLPQRFRDEDRTSKHSER